MIQANPLNTYLSTKPSFTSPQPLAAASGLIIPIQITLSEIKLSAFIVLVYSSQKGVTLVFRNDPLESLKVSSTFDAIPFVRDYLQKEIESQLRTLLMDELPLIIHRLSLRLFNKEYQERDDEAKVEVDMGEKPVDPLSTPPQDPVDSYGNILGPSQITSLSLDAGSESHALFSQRNLLRLGALTESHRTLSLFTPTLRDTVFRASPASLERGETNKRSTRPTPTLSRSHSYAGKMSTKYTFSEFPTASQPSSKVDLSSAVSGVGLSRYSRVGGRKRKHRVVDLRKKVAGGPEDAGSVSGESTTTSGTGSESVVSAPSHLVARPKTPEMKEPGDTDVGQTPPRPIEKTPRKSSRQSDFPDTEKTPRQSQYLSPPPKPKNNTEGQSARRPSLVKSQTLQPSHLPKEKASCSAKASESLKQLDPSPFDESASTQPHHEPSVWMNRIAEEILRKVHERKAQDARFWDRRGSDFSGAEEPPPAYGA